MVAQMTTEPSATTDGSTRPSNPGGEQYRTAVTSNELAQLNSGKDNKSSTLPVIVAVSCVSVALLLLACVLIGVMIVRRKRRDSRAAAGGAAARAAAAEKQSRLGMDWVC